MQRILVIRGGAIGDFVLTLPAIKLLRDAFPQSHLEILGYKHIIALAENRFYANVTRSIESGLLASFFAQGAELPRELANYFAGFDLVVSYLFDPDRVFEANLKRSGVTTYLACSATMNGQEHAAVQLAQPLIQLALHLETHAAQLIPSLEDRAAASRVLLPLEAPIAVIHPGSGSARKNWPVDRWQLLGQALLDSGDAGSLLVVGGEADGPALETLRSCWSSSAVAFAENLPLPQLAAACAKSAIFLGHDSGISHIAAAVGARCVLLFGPTDPAVWAPGNVGVRVLRAPSQTMRDIQLSDAINAVSACSRPSS